MSPVDIPEFASLLRRYRRRSRLTQEELAERASLSAASVSLLERGVTLAPQRATVSLLSSALALTADEASAFFETARKSRHAGSGANASNATDTVNATSAVDPQAPTSVALQGDLPVPLTALIGREREQTTLLDLLGRDTTRLLTLTGPAGVGKTRLALDLAATLRREQGQEVVFVGLIPVLEPERVLPAIAQALQVHESDNLPLREALIQVLRERKLVLVLDNFEQVLPAARAVLELLIACPHVKALVTSRSCLNVRGEQCFPVAPLALPSPEQYGSLAALQGVPAIALFLERARAVWPDLTVTTEADGALVAGICERLDGLPLVIELAAARARHFGLRQLHDRLAEPTFLGILADGAWDLADHQRTMRSTIAWSYHLLSDEEKRLFRWLGVFMGAASDALAAVAGVDDETLTQRLATLFDASLIRAVDSGGTRRYTQLATLRAYAQEQLRAEGEWDEARRRHASFFLDLVERTFPDRVDQPMEIMARLENEYENIRAALTWAWETGETMRGARMAGGLRYFWISHSQYLEGLDWLDRFITRAGTPANREELATLAGAWSGVMMLTHRLDRFERARQAGERALALYRELGDKRWIAYATMNVANPISQLRDYEQSRLLYEESLAIFRELGNRGDQVLPLMNLGGLYYEMGRLQEALAYNEESIAISREVGETDWARALTWNNIGEIYVAFDDPARAIEVTEPSYHLYTREHDIYGAATCAFTLGRAEWRAGHAETGRAYLDEAERHFRHLGNPALAARVRYVRASFALTAHNLSAADLAAVRHDLAQALAAVSGQPRATEYLWWLAERVGTLARYCGEPEQAARLYAAGVSHRDALPTPLEPVERELRAHDLAWLKTTLSEARLASIMAEGEALSLKATAADLTLALQQPGGSKQPAKGG